MEKKYLEILIKVSRNIFIITVLILLLNFVSILKIVNLIKMNVLITTVIISGIIFITAIQKVSSNHRIKSTYYNLITILMISCISIISILLINIKLISQYKEIINPILYPVTVTIIGAYLYSRNFIEDLKIKKTNDEEKIKSIKIINWLNNNIIKYKEIKHKFILIICIIIGFILRIWQLGFLSPFRDELVHMIATKRYLLEGFFYYDRTEMLTYIIIGLSKLTGLNSVFIGRLPSVIFGTLSIILIYLIGKEFNKWVGVISSFLFAISPWAIGMSRLIREYEINLFFMLLSIVFLNYISKRYEQKKLSYKFWILIVGVILINIYMVSSYNPTYLLNVIILFIYLFVLTSRQIPNLFKTKWKIQKKQKNIAYLILKFSFLILIFLLINYKISISNEIITSHEYRYFDLLFKTNNEYQNIHLNQWFEKINSPTSLLILIIIIPLILTNKGIYYNLLIPLIVYLFSLTYLTQRYFQERYAYYIHPFQIILFSMGIFVLINFILKIKDKKIKYSILVISILVLFMVFNPLTAVKLDLNEKNNAYDFKNGIYHFDVDLGLKKLENIGFKEGTPVITANYDKFSFYKNYSFVTNKDEEVNFYINKDTININGELIYDFPRGVYPYFYNIKGEKIRLNKQIICKKSEGYIMIDYFRNQLWSEGWETKNQTICDREVVYHGNFGGYDIFSWN